VAFALWIRSHDDGADLSDSHVQSEEQNWVILTAPEQSVPLPARTRLRYLKYPKKSATLMIAPTINAMATPA
jgi:hypothetical protein